MMLKKLSSYWLRSGKPSDSYGFTSKALPNRGFGILPNKQFCNFDAVAEKCKIRKWLSASYACSVTAILERIG